VPTSAQGREYTVGEPGSAHVLTVQKHPFIRERFGVCSCGSWDTMSATEQYVERAWRRHVGEDGHAGPAEMQKGSPQ
jgi:hypothetical protein